MERTEQSAARIIGLIEALTFPDLELDKEEVSHEEKSSKVLGSQGKWFKEKNQEDREYITEIEDLSWLEEDEPEVKTWYSDILKDVFNGEVNNFKKARQLYNIVLKGDAKTAFFTNWEKKERCKSLGQLF